MVVAVANLVYGILRCTYLAEQNLTAELYLASLVTQTQHLRGVEQRREEYVEDGYDDKTDEQITHYAIGLQAVDKAITPFAFVFMTKKSHS